MPISGAKHSLVNVLLAIQLHVSETQLPFKFNLPLSHLPSAFIDTFSLMAILAI